MSTRFSIVIVGAQLFVVLDAVSTSQQMEPPMVTWPGNAIMH